ncbi:MAG: sodium:proton antiporter, partial [Okeania sp. SIO2D1]|nr:sodium:proton antiporter [Okeania sp. SIO2D1]
SNLADNILLIAVAIGAVLVTRAISVYSLSALSNLVVKSNIGLKEQTLLWWGGLRGSVSIALVLSVPVVLPGRDEITAVVFGVVLFTLLVQGLTTQSMLKVLGLIGDQPLRQEYMETTARRVALKRVLNYVSELVRLQEIDPEYYRYQAEFLQKELKQLQEKIDKMQAEHSQLVALDMKLLREELVDIEAETYAEFIRAGKLNSNISPLLAEVFEEKEEQES